jgi:hypothetical protein
MKILILSFAGAVLFAMAVCSALAEEAGKLLTAFALTIPDKTTPPGPAPEGMVWIPGGEFFDGQ